VTVAADDENNNNDNNSAINSQDALIILRSSFSAPKVLHLFRCSPPVSHNSLAKFDTLLRRSVQHITNSGLTDIQWIQASLPVKDGGLGVRRVFARNPCLSGFSSKHKVSGSQQDDILAECFKSDSDFLLSYLSD